MATYTHGPELAFDSSSALYAQTRGLLAPYTPLILLRDTPRHLDTSPPPACSRGAFSRDVTAPSSFDVDPSTTQRDDAAAQARATPHSVFVDLTHAFCTKSPAAAHNASDGALRTIKLRCPPVIGGVFVFADRHHITPEYMATTADLLEDALKAANATLRWLH
jgi:hypothetical protein